jgi:hypothetical protein
MGETNLKSAVYWLDIISLPREFKLYNRLSGAIKGGPLVPLSGATKNEILGLKKPTCIEE